MTKVAGIADNGGGAVQAVTFPKPWVLIIQYRYMSNIIQAYFDEPVRPRSLLDEYHGKRKERYNDPEQAMVRFKDDFGTEYSVRIEETAAMFVQDQATFEAAEDRNQDIVIARRLAYAAKCKAAGLGDAPLGTILLDEHVTEPKKED